MPVNGQYGLRPSGQFSPTTGGMYPNRPAEPRNLEPVSFQMQSTPNLDRQAGTSPPQGIQREHVALYTGNVPYQPANGGQPPYSPTERPQQISGFDDPSRRGFELGGFGPVAKVGSVPRQPLKQEEYDYMARSGSVSTLPVDYRSHNNSTLVANPNLRYYDGMSGVAARRNLSGTANSVYPSGNLAYPQRAGNTGCHPSEGGNLGYPLSNHPPMQRLSPGYGQPRRTENGFASDMARLPHGYVNGSNVSSLRGVESQRQQLPPNPQLAFVGRAPSTKLSYHPQYGSSPDQPPPVPPPPVGQHDQPLQKDNDSNSTWRRAVGQEQMARQSQNAMYSTRPGISTINQPYGNSARPPNNQPGMSAPPRLGFDNNSLQQYPSKPSTWSRQDGIGQSGLSMSDHSMPALNSKEPQYAKIPARTIQRPSTSEVVPRSVSTSSPWQREEKEVEMKRLEEDKRRLRDEEISELESGRPLNHEEMERLRRLKVDAEFDRRMDEVSNQEDLDDDTDITPAVSSDNVNGSLYICKV